VILGARQEFDEWFPGSKFVLTVRKDSTALVDSEIGMKLKNEGKRFFFGTGSVSLSSAIRSYTQITNPKQQANAKKFLQNVLVWALLTQRRWVQLCVVVI
jgi:hypothetical protein